MKLAGKQVKAEVAKEHLNSAPLDFAAVAKAAQAAADAANAKRAREVAAGKRLAAEGELCDGMGRQPLPLPCTQHPTPTLALALAPTQHLPKADRSEDHHRREDALR